MLKKILFKIFLAVVLLAAPWSGLFPAQALTSASDLLSMSAPGLPSNHTITIRTTKDIPPGGRLAITPQSGFFVPDGFDYLDVDLAVSAGASGPYVDRELGWSASGTADGVSVSASTTSGALDIVLSSSAGISAGQYIQIKLGTNAVYGGSGDSQIVNPGITGAYEVSVYTYDNAGAYLERSYPKVYIIRQVVLNASAPKRRLSGSPIGWLSYGTSQTVISLITNYRAFCKYDTASSTPYDSMANSFNYLTASGTGQYLHTTMISGLTNGGHYDIFVRCEDMNGVKDDITFCEYDNASTTPYFTASGTPILELECVDYYIPFAVSSIEGATGDDTGDGTGGTGETGDDDGESSGDGTTDADSGSGSASGGGSAGGSGGGSGGGIGDERSRYLPYPPAPGAPGVILQGYAYPSVDVTVLKDGAVQGKVLASTDASFGAFLEELPQGVYTFGMWAEDKAGRKSNTYSTTFWIDDGTQTTVTDIILPPTFSVSSSQIDAGGMLRAEGASVPGQTIEVWLYPAAEDPNLSTATVKTSGVVAADGSWSLLINTESLVNGFYRLKAKTKMSIGESGFSQIVDLSVGGEPEPAGVCEGADLNRDGQVNIIDFSILLYYWNTNNECADQNKSGNVDLIDFSIMMYYWTG